MDNKEKLETLLKFTLEIDAINTKLINEISTSELDRQNGFEYTEKLELMSIIIDNSTKVIKTMI